MMNEPEKLAPSREERFAAQRHMMVEEQLRNRGIRGPRVLEAMERVPRHEFVGPEYEDQAYEDHPIPIGSGQTVSQPYIVAAMLESLKIGGGDVVLEVGTGSGYQTALLSLLAARVYSIERHPELADEARRRLEALGYKNVMVFTGDGSQGLPEHAPFDEITVGAAAPRIPEPLFRQLRDGGRMILPVGTSDTQELWLVTKENGRPVITRMEACRFVPLIGSEGFIVE
ncbi:MAG TPA: protein-L-isoaspartate(D-aspartate) O-methyltransferase [Terriglobales bacterium]|nr:protein-L-isoaspartate(D-aspartate) O-methyltransferase [Terriglobales bacterium]